MPVILVIIIMVAWLVILGPNLLKRRSHVAGGISSISHFHRQLRVLEHSSPEPLVTPAYRLRTVDGSSPPVPGGDGHRVQLAPKLTVVGADRLPRPALAFLGEAPVETATATAAANGPESEIEPTATGAFLLRPTRMGPDPRWDAGYPAAPGAARRSPDAHGRARARRRRRDTLGVLSLVFVGTLMIGFVPGAAVVWALTLASGLALAAYVALLVRMRQRAEERGRKLHYLRPADGSPNGVSDLPVRISGRYAHPSNQAAAAR